MSDCRETMNNEERLMAIFRGETPDRVPFYPLMAAYSSQIAGIHMGDIYAEPEKSLKAQLLTKELYNHAAPPRFAYAPFGGWEVGGEVRMPYGKGEMVPTITKYPWETREAIDKYEVPEDVSQCGIIPYALRCYDQLPENMLILCQVGSTYKDVNMAVGSSQVLKWTRKDPELLNLALEKMLAFELKVAELYVKRYGAHRVLAWIGTSTESNQLISPKIFEQFSVPYIQKLYDKVAAMGVDKFLIHICGDQNLNAPIWQTINFHKPSILSFGHEMELAKVVEMFGDRCIIGGNMNTSLIASGTPQQVYEEAKNCLLAGKKTPRGYILMSGCEYPPFAPPINMFYINKAVQDFGFYE